MDDDMPTWTSEYMDVEVYGKEWCEGNTSKLGPQWEPHISLDIGKEDEGFVTFDMPIAKARELAKWILDVTKDG